MEKLFVFDIDDTMYDQQHAFKRAINKLNLTRDIQLDIPDLYQLMKKYGDETFSLGFEKEILKEMQKNRIKKAFADYDIELSDEQAFSFQMNFETYQSQIELFPKMEQLLNFLVRKKQNLGIITNGTLSKQTKKIEALNLERWFAKKNILISQEAGISKPEKEIFQLFKKKFYTITNENVYYIGDNYFNDIIGPKSVGWKTIWVNYREYTETKNSLADYTVKSTDELFCTIYAIVC